LPKPSPETLAIKVHEWQEILLEVLYEAGQLKIAVIE